ncbi:putative cytochrome P450 oxidoreductase [Curvularia clavata]|uniref:Cytochrome P450 oxidoreductase n=1 Tax=Curvularia clavata TaxID=95742 RepID=A0A9Q8Z2D7_CURCL|nr:putative cytochrome P450 oxidoreductase [Curvularia clavata]
MSHLLMITIALVLVQGLRLWRNIAKARATGLRVVVTPLLETQVFAQLATLFLRRLYLAHLDAGKGWPRWCRFMIKDWSWEDKRLAHEEYGDTFICVSPDGMICYTADAALAWDVMNRRSDFTKPRDKYSKHRIFVMELFDPTLKPTEILEPYGPNVATAEGAEYRFHVRITAPAFSETNGINKLVWDETMHQTQTLLSLWAKEPPKDIHENVNALTLAVISLAAFGKKLESVTDQERDVPTGYKISFLRAISDTTTFMLAILVFPAWLLKISPYAKAQLAHSQLDKYLRGMIRVEKKRIEGGTGEAVKASRRNLLNMVVGSSYEAGLENQKQHAMIGKENVKKHAFTDDEVMGNLFIYLLAGYETTANAIAYGIFVLALEPMLQQKLSDSIDKVWSRAAAQGRTRLSYEDDFAELQYLYGFMYETFRLYPGVTLITKMCHDKQEIRVDNMSHVLPAGCRVYLSAPGVHYHEKYWENPTELRPERWNSTQGISTKSNHAFDNEAGTTVKSRKAATVAADKTRQMRGTLLTFSDGARVCLGRKFAQAEYMAFFAALLHEYDICFAEGTDVEQARRDINWKCAGKVTLTPLHRFQVTIKKKNKST